MISVKQEQRDKPDYRKLAPHECPRAYTSATLPPWYAARQKVAGHFMRRLKRIHTGEDVKGNAETTEYLHGFSFASEITCSYFSVRQL